MQVNAAGLHTTPLIAPVWTTACTHTIRPPIPTIIIFYFRLRLGQQIKTNVSGPAGRELYAWLIARCVDRKASCWWLKLLLNNCRYQSAKQLVSGRR